MQRIKLQYRIGLGLAALCALPINLSAQSEVKSWGYNAYGTLGNGTTMQSLMPISVLGPGGMGLLSDIVAISHGGAHCLALKTDGTVWAWGDNENGELGTGNNLASHTPIQVKSPDGQGVLSGVVAIATAGTSSLALKSDGTLLSWGYNYFGQLGNGGTDNQSLPGAVVSESGSGSLSGICGIAGGGGFYLALKRNGTLYSWGSDSAGEQGDNFAWLLAKRVPGPVLNPLGAGPLRSIVSFCGGNAHAMAVSAEGTLYAWGSNSNGQIGQGDAGANGEGFPTDRGLPTAVKSPDGLSVLGNIERVAAGDAHSLALARSGNVYSWGANTRGQLGDGTLVDRSLPYIVQQGGVNLSGVSSLSAGAQHSFAVKSDHSVLSWGANNRGQLGNGTQDDQSVPGAITGLAGINYIASSYDSSLAVSTGNAEMIGNVALGDISPTAPNQFVLFEFLKPNGTLAFSRFASVPASGNYHLRNLPRMTGMVRIKGSHWTSMTVQVDLSSGLDSGVQTSGINGDIDGNNRVDLTDLVIILNSYGYTSNSPQFDKMIDLNDDNKINLTDLIILLNNYGESGSNRDGRRARR